MFEPLWTTSISVPLLQIVLFLTAGSLSLVLGKFKLSLIIFYCGMLYWGFFLNPELRNPEGNFEMDAFTLVFLGFGVVILFLALIGLFTHQD
jgi:hypothetical protein